MIYLTDTEEMKDVINDLQETDILWIDTEVADYDTKNPRLSLIQILAYPHDLAGDRTYIFDVLNNSNILTFFIDKIMKNEQITKVFHNAQYDLRFLGKKQANNILCTLELAKQIPFYILPIKKYNLKTLTEYFTDFSQVNKDEQGSDWGMRPLSSQQLQYAQMDCVYLAQIYQKLILLEKEFASDAQTENIEELLQRYQELEEHWLYLDSEIKDLKNKIKAAMLAQNQPENPLFKLTTSHRKTIKTKMQDLIDLAITNHLDLEFKITLTKDMQSDIGQKLSLLKIEVEEKNIYSLRAKN